MQPTHFVTCDGCGQPASPEHIARRIQRLEWTTRYRPIHIGTLVLGAVSPISGADFLYSGNFEGEAGRLLEAVGISTPGKSAETVLNEFQRGGFLLTHLLECPLDGGGASPLAIQVLLERCVSSAAARIRRSLKPKRIILISEVLEPLLSRLTSLVLECPVILDDGKPFKLDSSNPSGALKRLRGVVNTANPGM